MEMQHGTQSRFDVFLTLPELPQTFCLVSNFFQKHSEIGLYVAWRTFQSSSWLCFVLFSVIIPHCFTDTSRLWEGKCINDNIPICVFIFRQNCNQIIKKEEFVSSSLWKILDIFCSLMILQKNVYLTNSDKIPQQHYIRCSPNHEKAPTMFYNNLNRLIIK